MSGEQALTFWIWLPKLLLMRFYFLIAMSFYNIMLLRLRVLHPLIALNKRMKKVDYFAKIIRRCEGEQKCIPKM